MLTMQEAVKDISSSNGSMPSFFSCMYLDDRVKLSIHPAHLWPDGKSVGHIVIETNDPQHRSHDGSYPLGVNISRAKIITKPNNPAGSTDNKPRHQAQSYITANNELRLNFIPDKNIDESELAISTPWGNIRERVKYQNGFKHSLYETFESIIYAFIIAIVIRTFFFQAFFIPSQSMEDTLHIGDRLVANKIVYFTGNPKRQEVAIFKTFAPKDRMQIFHLEDSPHFDPTRNLKSPDQYKTAEEIVRAIVTPDFRDMVTIRDGALYAGNLCFGFPEPGSEPGKILIDGEPFASGEIGTQSFNIPDQVLDTVYIDANRLVLGDRRMELGRIDVFYPMGHSGLVQFPSKAPRNPVFDFFKSAFFNIIGRKPYLLVGENQPLGNLIKQNGQWTIFGKPLDLDLSDKAMRSSLTYQGLNGETIQIGELACVNGQFVLQDGGRILKVFGKPILKNDVAFVNDQMLGYVERSKEGFLINGMPLTEFWETRDFIKRVIGLPGDVVNVEKGKVSVNDVALVEPYLTEENMRYDNFGPYIVPDKHYFMMGDNRGNSKDSRMIGPIPRDNIVGKAMFVFWPFNHAKGIPQ